MQKKPNSIKPWKCVILAIDPGKVSGAAYFVNGVKHYSGTTEYDDAKDICIWASQSARHNYIPLIVVIESHNRHGKWSPKALAGTAESVGVWKHYIDQLPKLKWKPKILRVPVDMWRAGIYGHCRTKHPKLNFNKKTRVIIQDNRDYWKRLACKTAGVDDDNAAEAILIGRYACHWGKVGEQSGVVTV